MKNVFWISTALLFLAACGGDDSKPAATDTAPAEVEEAPAGVAETAADEAAEEEVLEVVEESAAEPDSEEQAIMLASTDAPAAPREWQFKENQHYVRLVPTQPTIGGADKIEVAEFFWYGCPHCFDFERYINGWAAEQDPNTRFVRVPAMWNNGLKLHAQLYYTEEVLARNGTIKDPAAFRQAVFIEYHQRGNRLASQSAIKNLFARFDVPGDEFDRTWSSFEVAQKLRVADDLARRYGIGVVPAMVVNGKYRTGAAEAGSNAKLLDVLDELVARESMR